MKLYSNCESSVLSSYIVLKEIEDTDSSKIALLENIESHKHFVAK